VNFAAQQAMRHVLFSVRATGRRVRLHFPERHPWTQLLLDSLHHTAPEAAAPDDL